MARCEDFPCCGHEMGCCPDYDPQTGEQLNMRCVCGAILPIDRGVSICDSCLRLDDEDYRSNDPEYDYCGDEEEEDEENWEDDYDGQPDEMQEWHDYDPDC